MKIILIQTADTGFQWASHYNAAAFERAVDTERGRGAKRIETSRSDASYYRVYTDTSRAALETAELLFDLPEPPERTELLDDVPLRAFRDSDKELPLRLWRAMGEVQWYVGGGRQTESRQETARRVRQLVERLEAEDRDCVVICRGLAMRTLKSVLRSRGYCLEGGGLRARPLERVRATKQSQHCGGCHHNCLLSDPKCQIGMNKAGQRRI